MSTVWSTETEPQLHPRDVLSRPGPIPDSRLDGLLEERSPPPSLVVRDSSSTSSSVSGTVSCGPKDTTGPCERSVSDNSNTLPIILGVVIPLGIALVLLVFLHRRHVRKLRQEDAEDKHKSLDFGLDEGQFKNGKHEKNLPPMAMADPNGAGRRNRGLSMDLNLGNPYLLPPELHQSRESLHSLSRSFNTGDDKYRATTFVPDDGSIRPASSLRSPIDDSSSFTGSSRHRFDTESHKNLLRNAQANPRSGPPTRRPSITSDGSYPPVDHAARKPLASSGNNLLVPGAVDPTRDSFVSTASSNGGAAAFRASNNYLGAFISGGGAAAHDSEKTEKGPIATVTEVRVDPPPEDTSRSPPVPDKGDGHFRQTLAVHSSVQELTPMASNDNSRGVSPERQPQLPHLSFIDSQGQKQPNSLDSSARAENVQTRTENVQMPVATNDHDATVPSIRFEPPSHHPSGTGTSDHHPPQEEEDDYYDEDVYSNPEDYGEEYLEYDPRMLTMGMRPLPPDDPTENPEQRAIRIRSFYKEYFDETKSGHPVQYYDGSEDYYEGNYPAGGPYGASGSYRQPHGGPPDRHRAHTFSDGSALPSPRAFSSTSGRYGYPPPSRQQPKKRQPPPKPLYVLPTPHLLKEDTFLPVDFAPPNLAKNQRSGTPDNLRGGMRPYSPTVRAHIPLVSSFDDLAVMPSP